MMNKFETYITTELGLAVETLSAYKRDVQEFLDFAREQELTPLLVEKFIANLHRRGLKETTIRRKCMSVRCWCHFLASLNLVDSNIHEMIDPVRTKRRTPDAIESEDVDGLVSAVGNRIPASRTNNIRRDIAIVLTIYHSGLRVSELCNLDIKDINRSRRDIRVMGKGRRERIVPTTHDCMKAICDYIDLDRQSKSEAVFVKRDGSRVTRRAVADMLRALSNRSGIKHTTPHLLRRSCATSLMNNGVELELIQCLLGHRNLQTTQSYLSVDQKRLVDVHERCHPFGEKHAVTQKLWRTRRMQT